MLTKAFNRHVWHSVLNFNKSAVPQMAKFVSQLMDEQTIPQNQISSEKSKSGNRKIYNNSRSGTSEEKFLVRLKDDPDTFGSLNSKNDMVDEGDLEEEKFFEQRALPSQKLSTKKYADIIKSLIKQRKIKEAIDVLEEKMLKQDQFKPEGYIYNLLLGACGRVGYTKKAFSLYNDMKKRGLKVTPGTYTALFNACSNSPWPETDGLERAKHLRNIMIEKMYEPNDTNYHAMIKAFGRCGDLSTAFSIVDEMMFKKIKLTDDTFNFLLQACITDKESGFRHALLVWTKMMRFRITPSHFTYNLMLRSIRDCNLGDIDITQDVISQILNRSGVSITQDSNKLILSNDSEKLLLAEPKNALVATSNTALQLPLEELNSENCTPNLMAKNPHLGNLISLSEVTKPEERLLLVGGMHGFLSSMKENGCVADIKTFTLLLDDIPNTSAAENQLLSLMKSSDVKFDIDFFNMLIKRRSMRLDYQGAKDVLKFMVKYGLKPNLITYGVLSLSCKTKEEALEIINEMKESKYRLNAVILGAMVHQACYHKRFPYIMEIMEICIRENINPNKKFIEHLDNFKTTCRRMIKDENDKLGQTKAFQTGFQMFRMRYKIWLTKVQIDESEHVHPWQQFKEPTDQNTDKYYKEKDRSSRFQPRHKSQYRVKTSLKNFENGIRKR